MSTPASIAPDEPERIRAAVIQALRSPPAAGDPAMAALRDAVIGAPLLAGDEDGKPAFWLVPVLKGEHACGYARAEPGAARVTQISTFGAGPRDSAAWPQAAYFQGPPAHLLAEVQARHPGAPLAAARFSFDASPARWAWRVDIGDPVTGTAFIAPAGWYERPAAGRRAAS